MKLCDIISEEIQNFNCDNYNIKFIISEELEDYFSDDEDSLSDRVYNKTFGISTEKDHNQGDNQNNNSSDYNGKYVGTFTKLLLGKDTYIPVYLNPPNLSEFDNDCRAVLLPNAKLFIVKNRSVYHEELITFLIEKNLLSPGSEYIYYNENEITKGNVDFVPVRRDHNSNYFEISELYNQIKLSNNMLDILDEGNEKLQYKFVVNDLEVVKGFYNKLYY